MVESSSAKADTFGQDVEEETERWTILLASIVRWTRRMFAFPLIIARKKLVGQRVTVENQIRGLAVLFGIRLPARSPQPSSTRLSKPAKGSRVSLSPYGD
jgi:hypothetical protein